MTALSAARHRWARSFIRRCPDAPPYGSAAWLALPEGDAGKVAAVVRAAECWATDGDNLEANLRAEVEALSAAHKAADDTEYVARRDAHREEWANLPSQVARLEEARRRRAELDGGVA